MTKQCYLKYIILEIPQFCAKPNRCAYHFVKQYCFIIWINSWWINSLRPRQNGRLFADDTFKRIFFNENIRISTKISLKFVHKGLINNIPALVLIMSWRRPGDKPLSEPMLVRSLTHICVTRPQWVNNIKPFVKWHLHCDSNFCDRFYSVLDDSADDLGNM